MFYHRKKLFSLPDDKVKEEKEQIGEKNHYSGHWYFLHALEIQNVQFYRAVGREQEEKFFWQSFFYRKEEFTTPIHFLLFNRWSLNTKDVITLQERSSQLWLTFFLLSQVSMAIFFAFIAVQCLWWDSTRVCAVTNGYIFACSCL